MMNTLILDCSVGMNVCLLAGKQEFLFVDETEKKHSDELLAKLDELLNKAKVKISEINNICVLTGPGSFTGVRVAISVCKGLAVGTKAKIFALSNLDVYEVLNKQKSLLVLDGFSQFVYCRIFENGSFVDKCLTIAEVEKLANIDGYGIYVPQEKLQKRLNLVEKGYQNVQNITKNAFLEKIAKDDFVLINQIMPMYLRASQAEIERDKKLAGE